MSVPQVRINQTVGQIGMKWTDGYFKLKNKQDNVDLEYQGAKKPGQVVGEVKIDNPPAKVEIDQTACLDDLNFRKFNSLIKHLKKEAIKKTAEGIVEIAREGDQLMMIEKGFGVIPRLAKSELEDKKKFGIKSVPASKPKINAQLEQIKVNVDKVKIKVRNRFSFPEVEVKGKKVDIYLAQRGKIDISVKSG